jgi:hypothetical protein
MRRNPESTATRRAEIVGMLRAMPTKWRRAYNTARRTLADNGGPVLPDVPTPEQAMLILANTAGGNRDIDQPTGDQPVPQNVRDEAMHGLRLSYKHDYPGWEFFGIARAIQLVLAPGVPMRTRERMKRYLESHQKDKLAPHYGDEERPSNGYMAMLNWGGDAGLAWNEDVKRATYSSRTRGEGRMATRRKNPMYYREPGQKNFRPATTARVRAMIAQQSPGSHPLEHFGDNRAFWTPTRMRDFLAANPQFETARFADPWEAVGAVTDALEDMVAVNDIPDLEPAGGYVLLTSLAGAVPLYRELGASTSVDASDRTRIQPFAVGFVPFRLYMSGRALGVQPLVHDYGSLGGITADASVGMVRPSSRKPRVGDIVYTMPLNESSYGDLSHYMPARVLEVRTVASGPGSNGITEDSEQYRVQSIGPGSTGHTYMVDEWKLLREDEMPPSGRFPAFDPTRAAPAPAPTPARARRASPAPAPAPAPAGEALTAEAIQPPAPAPAPRAARKSKPKVIAVVSAPSNYNYWVLLLDSNVLKQKEVGEADVLGAASASLYGDAAKIGVAAAEKGYALLLYSTLATLVASQNRGKVLMGSSNQTEYAKRFWRRQPNGAIPGLTPKQFSERFGTTYKVITDAGEDLVQRLSRGNLGSSARSHLWDLGSKYFADYYAVSSLASSSLGPALLPRPAAPRETVVALEKKAQRKISPRNLAYLLVRDAWGTPRGYLFEIPRGASTLTPESLVAVNTTPENVPYRDENSLSRYGRFSRNLADPDIKAITAALLLTGTFSDTAANRKLVEGWKRRGEALKTALEGAGQTNLHALMSYLRQAAESYGLRLARLRRTPKTKFTNPRRMSLAIPIFMPV